MNKSGYIASQTYQFCWQYEIILIWKMWSSSLSQLNVHWFLNITLLFNVYRNDWLKLTFNCFFTVQSGNYEFQLTNHLTYLICFCYNFLTELKKQTLTCFIFLVLLQKNVTVYNESDTSVKNTKNWGRTRLYWYRRYWKLRGFT